MRQQSESHPHSTSGYTTESNQARKQRMDKKRAIRKNKIGYVSEQPIETKQEKRFLSKEQKIQLQKAKNREAAQRSRDQHKKYVEQLEGQIDRLKQQLSKPKFCSKCSVQFISDSGESTDPSFIDFQNSKNLHPFVQDQNIQELQEFESPFVRMQDYEQSSPLKMFLFVSMIVLGVLILNGSTQSTIGQNPNFKRDLIEIQNLNNGQNDLTLRQKKQFKQIQQIKKFDLMNQMENSFNVEDKIQNQKIMTDIAPLSYQLSPLSRENCIKSIINQNYTNLGFINPMPQVIPKSSLRTTVRDRISQQIYQMEVFSPKNNEKDHNILFCSLPKLYRKNQNQNPGFLSKFIDIIISGSEVMQIIGKQPDLWMNKMINFNGLYKINAEVKQIVQIQDRNCIL